MSSFASDAPGGTTAIRYTRCRPQDIESACSSEAGGGSELYFAKSACLGGRSRAETGADSETSGNTDTRYFPEFCNQAGAGRAHACIRFSAKLAGGSHSADYHCKAGSQHPRKARSRGRIDCESTLRNGQHP